MPFQLPDGRTLALDTPFTWNQIQYPANWLRLSTQQQRAELGIVEVPDAPTYDQRFYWGFDADGKLIPKDHAELVEQWSTQTRTTANTLLTPTDWMVVREMDNGTPMSDAYRNWRQAVRGASEAKVAAIKATSTTTELATYVTSGTYSTWPLDPANPSISPSPSDGVEPFSNVVTTGF